MSKELEMFILKLNKFFCGGRVYYFIRKDVYDELCKDFKGEKK